MKFTFEDYAALIECVRTNGYVITNYSDYKQYEKAVIIKHDVDLSLKKAAEFAKLECALGIKTVYNILLCSDFYNPYSQKNMEYILRIKNMGHEIGLHFDEVRYQGNVLDNINHELDILEQFLGERVKSLSMHRPSEGTLKADYKIDGGRIINSYGEEFFKEFKYVSDSRMNWREDPFETVECGKYNKIHILTHPVWYTKEEKTLRQHLEGFLEQAKPERYEALEKNIRDLQSVL